MKDIQKTPLATKIMVIILNVVTTILALFIGGLVLGFCGTAGYVYAEQYGIWTIIIGFVLGIGTGVSIFIVILRFAVQNIRFIFNDDEMIEYFKNHGQNRISELFRGC